MKKAVSFLLVLTLILALFSFPASAAGAKLAGSWGEKEYIRNGRSSVFTLDSKVTGCRELSMTLSVTDYSGFPFGDWYLYAKDLNDNWDHIAMFKLEKSMADGHSETYNFTFKTPQSFKALALSLVEKGTAYSISWTCSFSMDGAQATATPKPTSAPASGGGTKLTGTWGEMESIHNGRSSPFNLDSKVTGCKHLSMAISVTEYTGAPFGNWYLYAKDLDGNWNPIADFKLDKSMGDGHTETYDFNFKTAQSFKALALCMRDKGNVYSLSWRVTFSTDAAQSSSPTATPKPTAAPKSRTKLTGTWSDPEPIHNGRSTAFYLDKMVTRCEGLTMTLSIWEYTGAPFGNWYLYAKDLDGNWNHIADFKLDKSMGDGHTETYRFTFSKPQSFQALALCMRDKGNYYNLTWDDISFYTGD